MSGLELAGALVGILGTVAQLGEAFSNALARPLALLSLYGPLGITLWLFGDSIVWTTLARLLKTSSDADALAYKSTQQHESNMMAVAATIVAQIDITALSLSFLSETHWTARAFWVTSLVSSIMAIYYATNLARAMGRIMTGPELRHWIRGYPIHDKAAEDRLHIMDSIEAVVAKFKVVTGPRVSVVIKSLINTYGSSAVADVLGYYSKVDPYGRLQDLVPSQSSVLILCGPINLLAVSLNTFLIGLGIYLGFVWTNALDSDLGRANSKSVFIVFIVALGSCYLVYSLSSLIQANQIQSEFKSIIRENRFRAGTWQEVLLALAVFLAAEELRATQGRPDSTVQSFSTGSIDGPPNNHSPHAPIEAAFESEAYPNTGASTSADAQSPGCEINERLVKALEKASSLRGRMVEADEEVAKLLRVLAEQQRG